MFNTERAAKTLSRDTYLGAQGKHEPHLVALFSAARRVKYFACRRDLSTKLHDASAAANTVTPRASIRAFITKSLLARQ
jgi:hypothetical protein